MYDDYKITRDIFMKVNAAIARSEEIDWLSKV